MIPQEVKDRAMASYMKGDVSIPTIARSMNISAPTMYKWMHKGQWRRKREEAKGQAIVELSANIKDDYVVRTKEQLNTYEKLWKGAKSSIDANESFYKTLAPMDVVRTVDLGIQGQRKIQNALVGVQFAEDIFKIIVKYVADDSILRSIASDLRHVVAQYYGENQQ